MKVIILQQFLLKDEYSKKLKELGVNYIDINIDKGGTNPLKDLNTLYCFNKIYKASSYDVVLNFTPKNNIYSTLSAKFNNIKVINNIAGLGVLFINDSIPSKLARLLYKISHRKVDKVFFQNEDDRILFLENKLAKEYITDRLPGSGADLSRFKISPSIDDGVVRFLLIARMLYDKGIGHYVDAARELKAKVWS
ncbi:glycosyltransferase [Photobacterium leiognathi]|uniref:glycosyltransferase n=1 Tax=Photobacterium leiognathi TaxID=553611 RepID=UPI0027386CB2|nr:glycosyltransferase [Photobacterium leiognathi]